jgi:hypothetical protein
MQALIAVFQRGFGESARFALAAIRDHKLRAGLRGTVVLCAFGWRLPLRVHSHDAYVSAAD